RSARRSLFAELVRVSPALPRAIAEQPRWLFPQPAAPARPGPVARPQFSPVVPRLALVTFESERPRLPIARRREWQLRSPGGQQACSLRPAAAALPPALCCRRRSLAALVSNVR